MLEKISQGQFSKIITFLVIGTVFLTLPRRIALVAEWDSPISLIIGYGAAWFIGVIVIWISLNYPKETFVEYCKKIIGPYLGWIYCFLIFLVFMNLTIFLIRLAGVAYIATGYTETPLIIFSGITVILAVWILKEGIEVLGRVIEIFYIPLIFSVIILFISIIAKIDMNNLVPILAFGAEPVLNGVLVAFTTGVEHVFLLGLLVSKVQNLDKKIYLAHLVGVFTGFFVIFLMVVATIGVFKSYIRRS